MTKLQTLAVIILAAMPLVNSVPLHPRNQDCHIANNIKGGKTSFSADGDTNLLFADAGKAFAAKGFLGTSTSPGKIMVNLDVTGGVWVSTDTGPFHSTNMGASFTAIPGTTQAWAIVLGDSSPTNENPSVLAAANIGSIEYFRSDDGSLDWVKINDDTHGSGSVSPNVLNADPRIYGRGLLPTSIGPIAIPTISDPLTSILGSILPTSIDPIPISTASTAGNPLTSVLSSILPVPIPTIGSTIGDPLTSILGSILPTSESIIPIPTPTPTSTSAVSDPLTSVLSSILPIPIPTIGSTISDSLTSILGSIIPTSIVPIGIPTSDPLTSILPVSSILPISIPTIGSTISDPLTSVLSSILPSSIDPIPTPTTSTAGDPLTSILSSILPISIPTIL